MLFLTMPGMIIKPAIPNGNGNVIVMIFRNGVCRVFEFYPGTPVLSSALERQILHGSY
jgi:hypothetical protein